MTEQAQPITRHDLEAKIVKRCWEDEGFRREFTANPAGAFLKYLEVPAASLPKIVVHEESPGAWHIVLPLRPANADELSEEDLERVAAGFTATWSVASAAAVSAALVGGSAVASYNAAVTPRDKGW
jgi:hypothetical protein